MRGPQSFVRRETFSWVKNEHATDPVTPTYTVEIHYTATEIALAIPRLVAPFNCSPCDSGSGLPLPRDYDVDAIF